MPRRLKSANPIPFLRSGAFALAAAVAVVRVGGADTTSVTVPGDVVLAQQDLQYEGAFRLPAGLHAGGQANAGFEYGGTAIGFNPANRSLFVVGHDWDQLVGEVGIPDVRTGTLNDLSTAPVLQPLMDPTEGTLQAINPSDPNSKKIGGLFPVGNQLLISAYSYYDGAGTQSLSHFVRPISLAAKGHVAGPYRVGAVGAGFTSGYLASVPPAWQGLLGGTLLAGNCCLGVISRTSYGPAVFSFRLEALGQKPAPAGALVYYPEAHPSLGAWDGNSAMFNGTSSVRGVVFPEGTRSVLFFGRRGIGPFCYGPGTDDKQKADKPADGGVDRYCFDPADGSKGVHGFPYAYSVWAYDAADLAAVNRGQKRPWDVKPYAVWQLSLPYATHTGIGGATYDASTQQLYVSQTYADGTLPVIHVFRILKAGPRPVATSSGNSAR